MPPTRKYFSAPVLEAIDAAYVIGIRAGPTGRQAHRFIGIWAVVVDRRVFVRSWDITPGGWYDTIRKERRGHIHVGGMPNVLPVQCPVPRRRAAGFRPWPAWRP
jgi:hypothetical protein